MEELKAIWALRDVQLEKKKAADAELRVLADRAKVLYERKEKKYLVNVCVVVLCGVLCAVCCASVLAFSFFFLIFLIKDRFSSL